MYELSIASVFKNEGHILKEWIEHYRFHGFDHIYLINDNSTDNFLQILEPYIKENYVTLFNNDIETKKVGRQSLIYEKYLRNILRETKWLSINDLDEFLYSPSEINIKNILKKYNNYSSIEVTWLLFGSNGYIEQPDNVVQSFTKRIALSNIKGHWLNCKSIFKTNRLLSFSIHSQKVKGKIIKLNKDSNDLLINHYAIQSWDFFSKIKMTRGDCDNYAESINYERNKKHFMKYDINEEIDERLKTQNINLVLQKYIHD